MMVCMVYFSLYINHNNTPCIMQRIATPCFNGELSLVHQGIAALCYDRTRIKMGQQQDVEERASQEEQRQEISYDAAAAAATRATAEAAAHAADDPVVRVAFIFSLHGSLTLAGV